MHKIIIFGNGGSGKTTLSLQLEKKHGQPVLHLDSIYWENHWQKYPKDFFIEKSRSFLKQPGWIIEGTPMLDVGYRIQQASMVIVIEKNPLICLYNILRRSIRAKIFSISTQEHGCPELGLSYKTIKWVLGFNGKQRIEILSLAEKYNKEVLFFR